MQASVSGEIRWRIDLYTKCFEVCRNGGFSLARFLALVPDRLRISGEGLRISVTVSDSVGELIERSFADIDPSFERPRDRAELLRVLRMAQLDPSVDPVWSLAWLRRRGDALLAGIAHLYRRAWSEIGRGEGGEETAYLVHLIAIERLRRPRSQDALVALAMMMGAHDLMLESNAISIRLGLLDHLTMTAQSLGAEVDPKRHLNFHRTIPAAVELARRVIQEPIEMIPLRRVAVTIARRLAIDPAVAPILLGELHLEMIRDAAMLALMQLREPLPLLEELCRSEHALLLHANNERRRKLLIEAVRGRSAESPRPIAALLDLLNGGPESHAERIVRRAELAAEGAVLLVLDEIVDRLRSEVASTLDVVPESEWAAGRAYRIALDDAPLYRLSPDRPQATLFAAAAELPESLQIPPRRSGDVVEILELALTQRAKVKAHAEAIERGPPEVLGGRSKRLAEVKQELAEIARRIELVDAALRRSEGERESEALLIDGKASLEKQAALLEEVARELAPEPARAPMLIELGEISETVARAALGTTPWIVAQRASALEAARRARGVPVEHAFEVSVRRRTQITLPAELTAELGRAAEQHSPQEIATVAVEIGRWLRGEIEARARSPTLLAAWTDPRYEIDNRGLLITGKALAAWRREKEPALVFSERELVGLPDAIARRWLFDRDPERLLLARRAKGEEIVAVFRHAGQARLQEGALSDLWEVVRLDSGFALDLIALE